MAPNLTWAGTARLRLAHARREDTLCAVRPVLVPLCLFGIFITAAALAYPGGSWLGRDTEGYSFWHNFWCDLLSMRALNGEPNVAGSVLSRLAFACFAIALQRFWPVALDLSGRTTVTRLAERLGLFGAASLLVVAIVPAATSQIVHGIAVIISAGCSVIGVMLLLRGLVRQGETRAAGLGMAVALTTVVCLGQYVYQGISAHDTATWLAGMQKITTAFLLAFMLQLLARHRVRSELRSLLRADGSRPDAQR